MASLLLYCADSIKGDLDSLRDEVRDHYRWWWWPWKSLSRFSVASNWLFISSRPLLVSLDLVHSLPLDAFFSISLIVAFIRLSNHRFSSVRHPCLVLSCLVLSCLVLSCLILSCLVLPYLTFLLYFHPCSALGCDIVLDRDQDHNDLDKCLLTLKGRNKDMIAEAEGEVDVKVGDYQLRYHVL